MGNVSYFEIVVKLHNSKSRYKPKFVSKTQVCAGENCAIYADQHFEAFLRLNPIQSRENKSDTPVFAVGEDGSKIKVSTRDFFSKIVDEEWVQITVLLPEGEDIEDELWNEEIEDRVKAYVLKIDASSVENFNSSFSNEYAKPNINGRLIRHLEFKGEVLTIKKDINLKPLTLKSIPSVLTDEEYDKVNPYVISSLKNKAAKRAIKASLINLSDVEVVEVKEEIEQEKIEVELEGEVDEEIAEVLISSGALTPNNDFVINWDE